MIPNTELYDRALAVWGVDAQMEQTIEEMAELIVALRHFKRNRVPADKVIEEIADVEIMCGQLRRVFGEVLVDQRKSDKLERLEQRLDEACRPSERRAQFLRGLGCPVDEGLPGFVMEH